MVFSTMHKKSCIDLYNAWYFKNVPKFSHSHISQSQWRSPEIIFDTGFLGYLNYTTQLFCKLFPTQLTRIHIWNPTNLIWNYWHIICKTKLSKYIPFTHICIYSLCQFSDTGIIMTSQRRCHARDSQTMQSFSAMHDSSPPTSENRLQISAS